MRFIVGAVVGLLILGCGGLETTDTELSEDAIAAWAGMPLSGGEEVMRTDTVLTVAHAGWQRQQAAQAYGKHLVASGWSRESVDKTTNTAIYAKDRAKLYMTVTETDADATVSLSLQ